MMTFKLPGITQTTVCLTADEINQVVEPLRGSKDPIVLFFFERMRISQGWENKIPPEGIKFAPID
jgi:hypothetical protein